MNNLKKLALATAIAAAPLSVNALEALDDDFLGEVTGQEGITIDKHYQNTIEEFKYVDGDGSDGTAGSVSVKNIEIGEFTDGVAAPFGSRNGTIDGFDLNGTLTNVWERGQRIDAAADGVLITSAMIGEESIILDNQLQVNPYPFGHPLTNKDSSGNPIAGHPNTMLPTLVIESANNDGANFANVMDNALSSLPPTDASGNVLVPDGAGGFTNLLNDEGVAIKLRATYGNGKDTRIGSIEIGNANGTNASIGSLALLNQNNFVSMNRVSQLGQYFSRFSSAPTAQADMMGLIVKNSEKWIQAQTKISSKTSGTGVVIVSEGALGAQAVVYTDTDGAGENQVGVIGMASFRFTDNGLLSDGNDTATGQYLRGAKTTTTIDVEDGKLKLHQVKDGNTVLGKIFIGDVNRAQSHLVARADKGVIGGISILGNHWEGTTYISGH